jgi:elongation factor P
MAITTILPIHRKKVLPLGFASSRTTVEFPPFIDLEVTYTEAGERGNTASSTALKQATVETGAIIMVPLFINQNDIIRVDTRDRSYSERVKK